MLTLAALLGIAIARAAGLGRLRTVLLAAGCWLAGAVLLATAPGQGQRLLGMGWRGWVLLGAAVALTLAYGAALGWARARARPLGDTAADPRPAVPGDGGGAPGLDPSPSASRPSPDAVPPAGQSASGPAPLHPLPQAAVHPPADPSTPLSDAELDRYARHIILRELGGPGQRALRRARVLVVGAGGLGAPVCLYLAAAGVGRITLADDDHVSLSNLQRQVIFRSADQHRPKAEAAAGAMQALNPHVAVTPLTRRITEADGPLVAGHDLVIDGTDSFASRAVVNRLCAAAGVPLVAGAIAQWEGQVTTYNPARGAPCMACLFPEAPAPGLAPSCAEAGVVGALPGVVGSVMALEAIKLLAGTGQTLRGRMLVFDGLWGETRTLAIHRRADCPVCGTKKKAGGEPPAS